MENLFYTYLKEMGYDREEPLDPYPETEDAHPPVVSGNHSMTIQQFATVWENKDSYVYTGMLDDIEAGLTAKQVQRNMFELMKDVRFSDQSRVIELGWKWHTPQIQTEYTMDARHKLMWEFFRFAKSDIATGHWGPVAGLNGDTIIVYPYGDKSHFTVFNTTTQEIGTRQRQLMAGRMGFGALSEEGCMFATYRDGKLHKWDVT